MRFFRLLILAAFLALIAAPLGVVYTAPSNTFTATSVLDNVDANPGNGVCADAGGNCTLRAAVMEANALAGADTIILVEDTYGLTITGLNEDDAATGDLDLKGNLTISGAGPEITIIDAGQLLDRVFHVLSNSTVTITGVTIRNGNIDVSSGGGILNDETGKVTLTDSEVSGNTSFQSSGGIMNRGEMTITKSTISDNFCNGGGGGIVSSGTMTLTNSDVINNTSLQSIGGGIANSGKITLINTTVTDNEALLNGGGIRNGGEMTITNSTISGNHSSWESGGGISNTEIGKITLTDSLVSGNSIHNGDGGGVSSTGVMTITNNTISGNQAGSNGGGIENSGVIELVNSTISGNHATASGGGIYNSMFGDITSINSTINSNQSEFFGGGIRNFGSIKLINNTVSGNQAYGSGGGIYVDDAGTLEARNATIVDNTANADGSGLSDNGGGIKNDDGTVDLFNTILALNIHVRKSGDFLIAVDDDCKGGLDQVSYSLLTTETDCTFTNDNSITGLNPKMEALADNGGPTQTNALKADSPAIDAGNPNGCKDHELNDLTSDQRGELRPFDGDSDGTAVCDIGAYEYLIYQGLTIDKDGTGDGRITSAPAGIDCGEDCSADFAQGSLVALTAEPDADSSFSGWSGACSGTGDCQITMDAKKVVTATFEADLQLTVTKAGTGDGLISSSPAGIDCGQDCNAAFAQGSLITLTADPEDGSTFSEWSGACSGTGDCQITMNADKNVTANFTATVVEGVLKLFLPMSLR